MRRILFPTDFSDVSRNAFTYALHLAQSLAAEMVLFHAHTEPHAIFSGGKTQGIEGDMERFQEYYLQLQNETGLNVSLIPMVQAGQPTRSIISTIEDLAPTLVVMGTHGATNEFSDSFGSVTVQVLASTSVPLLAVPSGAQYKKIERIVFASDFHEGDIRTINQLIRLANHLDAQVDCVHVMGEHELWDRTQGKFFEQLYYLDQMTNNLDFHILHHQSVEVALREFIEEREVGMLALLTHRRKGLEEFLASSLTKKIALHTETPLLVFHE